MNNNDLKKNYTAFSDQKLQKIIEQDLFSLTDKALVVLHDELVKRNSALIEVFDKKIRFLEEIEFLIEERCKEIENLPCPFCKSDDFKLNGIRLNFVGFFSTTVSFFIGCNQCLYNKFIEARNMHCSVNFGGILGLIRAHLCLVENENALKELDAGQSSLVFRKFAKEEVLRNYYVQKIQLNADRRHIQQPWLPIQLERNR